MTVVERNTRAASRTAEFTIRPLIDREQIRSILEVRRPYAAYALGQLDPPLSRLAEWWLAHGDAGEALVLHSRGGLGNATFASGEATALDALLRVHPGAHHTFLTCEPHHLETVLRHFYLDQRQTMIRMQATRESFRPRPASELRRLAGADAREINRLYRSDGMPSFYSPRQIDDAVYVGAHEGGRLVSIAGTHVISSTSEIAVIGNVYTHAAYRGRGLAQATTSAVTAQLLQFCREVVLSVDPTNVPAVRAYENLGYREVARLIEGAATRRDMLGISTWLRRSIAGLRGRGAGREIVRVRRDE